MGENLMGLLAPVVVQLLADTKEYSAKMDESIAKMEKLGVASKTTSEKMVAMGSKAATAVVGLGVALGAYAVDQAYKFQEQLDKIRNQSGASAAEVANLGKAILNISTATGATTTDLTAAGLAMEQAGIRGKAGQQLLLDASKASVITGGSVVDVTKSIIAAQTLQLAKGMSLNNLTGLLVAGSQKMVGGLSAESSMLSGRVGVALAAVGLRMKDVIAAGAEFSKVGLNSRAVTSFATGLSKLNLPLDTVHVTAKKTYTTLSTYALSLQAVGLSQAKLATDLRVGGIPALLSDIKDAAGGSATKLQELLHVVFGTGAGTSQVLVNNLKQFLQVTKSIDGSGGKSLQTGFAAALTQIGPQMKVLKANFNALMISAGQYLLPKVSAAASWANQFFKAMKSDPGAAHIGFQIAGAFGAAAIGFKVAGPIGAAIALAITEAIHLGGVKNFADLITGKGVGRKKAGENILGSFWNSNVSLFEGLLKTAVTGNITHLLNQKPPDWLLYHQGSGNPNYSHSGAATIHHRVTVRVTR